MGLVSRYDGVVCDLDGVVYRGPVAVKHAVTALAGLDLPVVYATNNASRPPPEVAAHLTGLGLTVPDRAVATSSQAGAGVLREQLPPGSAVLAIGGTGVSEALRQCGLRVITPSDTRADTTVRAEGVLQGYGADVTAADLAEAAYAVAAGALWVATNTDGTLPTDRGTAPGNGTLVAAVQRAVGQEPLVVGKPRAPLYQLCADRLGLPPNRVLAVGDRLDTDIAGALAAGMDSVLVLTGVDSVGTLALAPEDHRPTYLVEDLRGLAADYVGAQADEGWWVCGADRRRVVDGEWEVASRGSAIEAARAGTRALHEALDAGGLDEEVARSLARDLDVWQ